MEKANIRITYKGNLMMVNGNMEKDMEEESTYIHLVIDMMVFGKEDSNGEEELLSLRLEQDMRVSLQAIRLLVREQ